MVPNDLLTDGIFRVNFQGAGIQVMNLPQLFAALGEDRVDSLPGLQSHQEDIFHIFLCYLAGAMLAREQRDSAVQDETFWHDALIRLSNGKSATGWSLVVDDVSMPAFLQPPLVPISGQSIKLDPKANSPDELDILQTAKNHDVKGQRAGEADADEWVYALIDIQTASGFLGQGNYGIARMNGGFGNRPCVALIRSQSAGKRFIRDVERLLSIRPDFTSGRWCYNSDGIALTWMELWDGQQSFALNQLDPFFTETARIVRLRREGGRLIATGKATKASRINSKDLNGVVGDAWTPIKNGGRGKISSLTVAKAGFTPQLLRELIFEDGYERAEMQRPDAGYEGSVCIFHASTLVRGQGVTEGFHSVDLPIPGRAATTLFGGGESRQSLEQTSKTAINDAAAMQNKVLGASLYCLLEAGPEQLNFDKREVSAWVAKARKNFSDEWSDAYFPWLWSTVADSDPNAGRLRWLEKLKQLARKALDNAERTLPMRNGRTYRARAAGEGFFYGAMYKNFPELKGSKDLDEHGS